MDASHGSSTAKTTLRKSSGVTRVNKSANLKSKGGRKPSEILRINKSPFGELKVSESTIFFDATP
eukprot:85076-Amorphochlora_amoeboformis.AAC.1